MSTEQFQVVKAKYGDDWESSEQNMKSGVLSCYKEQQLVPSKPSIGVPFAGVQLVERNRPIVVIFQLYRL